MKKNGKNNLWNLDFIATFAMPLGFDTYFDLQHSIPRKPRLRPVTEVMMKVVRATRAIVPSGTKEIKVEKKPLFEAFEEFVPLGTMAQVAQTPVYTLSDKIDLSD